MTTNPHVQISESEAALHMAIELSKCNWKLAFIDRLGRKPRVRSVPAGDLSAMADEIRTAKTRLGLSQDAFVHSCYEAGRDGFWIHRCLISMGIHNVIIEASSIQVSRRKRQAKTDRIDAEKMVVALIRFRSGDRFACRTIRVPDREAEDARHLHREVQTLKTEKTRHTNRIGSLLATQGINGIKINKHFDKQLGILRIGDGSPLGEGLCQRLLREFRRLQLAVEQIRMLEQQQAEMIRLADREDSDATRLAELAHHLMLLSGIGPVSSWTLSAEVFSWRDIQNRRQLGALAGLVPTPFASGLEEREQGISKSGRGELRALMIEIAWGWLTWQPESELSKWFHKRFGDNKRSRKRGIVALARKLLVSLGKYVRAGEVPAGAKLKQTAMQFKYTPSLTAPS